MMAWPTFHDHITSYGGGQAFAGKVNATRVERSVHESHSPFFVLMAHGPDSRMACGAVCEVRACFVKNLVKQGLEDLLFWRLHEEGYCETYRWMPVRERAFRGGGSS